MTRILGHVRYDSPAKPPAPVAAAVVRRRVEKSPRRSRPDPDTVYDWLLEFAKAGHRAPQRDAIVDRFGSTANDVVAELARDGRISIEIGRLNWRVIAIGRHRTQDFPHGAKPYRIIDKNGDRWARGDGKWETRR